VWLLLWSYLLPNVTDADVVVAAAAAAADAAVRDNDAQLTLVTDATLGGSSLAEGQVFHGCCGNNCDRHDVFFPAMTFFPP
jgi:predicted NBD/HSP70 family sugar kinase